MRLKVSSSNFYVGNKQPQKDAHFLADLGCDISGIQEGHSGNAQDIQRALHKTHVTYWKVGKDEQKNFAFLDVPVVYRKSGLHIIREWARQVSARAQVKNIGMQRAATAVRFEKMGHTVTFINTHLNAAVQNRTTKEPLSTKIARVAAYVQSIIVLEVMIRNAQKRGDLVVLVGDLNFSPQKSGVWKFSPQALFKRTGLHYRVAHIDYIAFSPEFKPSNFTEIPTSKTGSDHPWITLDLTTRH